MLVYMFGLPVLIGYSIMFVLLVVQTLANKLIANYKLKGAAHADSRIHFLTECVEHIRHLKSA